MRGRIPRRCALPCAPKTVHLTRPTTGFRFKLIMSIPLSYTWRNLTARKLTTLLTASGMALVVFVFATVLMLEEGLRKAMVDTGSPDNVILTRRSAGTEVQSLVERDQAAIVENQPEVAYGIDGARLASKETIVLIALAKRDSNKASNV